MYTAAGKKRSAEDAVDMHGYGDAESADVGETSAELSATGNAKTPGKRVQRRLQRNRKSAALHRERQKALVDGLIGRVTSLIVERDALR